MVRLFMASRWACVGPLLERGCEAHSVPGSEVEGTVIGAAHAGHSILSPGYFSRRLDFLIACGTDKRQKYGIR